MLNLEPAQFVPASSTTAVDGRLGTRRKRTTGRRIVFAGRGWRHPRLRCRYQPLPVGNYPPAVSIEACVTETISRTQGRRGPRSCPPPRSAEHTISRVGERRGVDPCGNIFHRRLRVYGQPVGALEAARPISWSIWWRWRTAAVRSVERREFGLSVTSLLLPAAAPAWATAGRPDGVASPATTGACSSSGAGTIEDPRLPSSRQPSPTAARCRRCDRRHRPALATTQSMFWQTLLPEQKLEMDAVPRLPERSGQARAGHPCASTSSPIWRCRPLAAPVGQGREEVKSQRPGRADARPTAAQRAGSRPGLHRPPVAPLAEPAA